MPREYTHVSLDAFAFYQKGIFIWYNFVGPSACAAETCMRLFQRFRLSQDPGTCKEYEPHDTIAMVLEVLHKRMR